MKNTWASREGGVRVAERDNDVGATMDGSAHSFQGYGRKVSADGGDPTFCWSL